MNIFWQRVLGRMGIPRRNFDGTYEMNQLQAFEAALRRAGRSLFNARDVFEFGCGEGRLIGAMMRVNPAASYTGAEVQPEVIAVAKRRMPNVRFIANGTRPPLELPDQSFDLIYTYSVFTHLTEENHRNWLKELARLLKPGGAMLHTVHSPTALESISRFSPDALPKFGLPASLESFIAAGPDYHYNVDIPQRPDYGEAIIRRRYIEARWPGYTGLKIVTYAEGAIESYPNGCHDLIVLG